MSQPTRERALEWATVLTAALLVLLPHVMLLSGARALFYDDARIFFEPLFSLVGSDLCRGRLPLWNPYEGLGSPLLADPQAGATYPASLLTCAVPVPHAFALSMLLHLGLLAGGAAALLRELGVRRSLAIGAGAALGLAGPAVSWMSQGSYLASLAWFPLMLLFARRLAAGRGGAVGGLGLSVGLAALAGDVPGTFFMSSAAFVLWRSTPGPRRLASLLGAATVALLVGGAAWLPLLWYLHLTSRAAGLPAGEAGHWSLHPLELVGLWWPNPLGLPLPTNTFWPFKWIGVRLYVHSLYVGAALASFGAVAMVRLRRDPFVRAATISALALVILASGDSTPLWAVLQYLFRYTRYPSKLVPAAVLLLAMCGAVGLERALQTPKRAALVAGLTAAVGLLAAIVGPLVQRPLAIAAGAPEQLSDLAGAAFRRGTLQAAGFAGVLALLFLLLDRRRLSMPLAGAAVGLLIVTDAAVAGQELSWTDLPPVVARPSWLPQVPPWGARVIRAGELNALNLHRDQTGYLGGQGRQRILLSQLESIRHQAGNLEGYGLQLGDASARLAELYHADPAVLAELTGADVLLVPTVPAQHWAVRALNEGRVRMVAAPPRLGAVVLAPTSPLPRAFTIKALQSCTPADELGRVFALEHRHRALISAGEALLDGRPVSLDLAPFLAGIGPGPDTPRAVQPSSWTAEAMSFEVDLAAPGLLVVTDVFLEGWHASVDDRPVPILRANRLGRAVVLPPGRHRVRFWFEVLQLRAGLWASAIGLPLALLLLAFPPKPKRSSVAF
jgi:hypothetical protein